MKFWRRAAPASAPGPAVVRDWHDIVISRQVPVDGQAEAARATNPLAAIFYEHSDRLAHKWQHYLEIYDQHLARYRGTPVRFLELGVFQGGSLQVWRRYFGDRARIHGLDINPACASIDDLDLRVHVGDQTDKALLDRVVSEMGGLDVVIDDASHSSPHQIATFEHLYPRLAENGIYIVEDVHASYWPDLGGGLRRPGTFMEYAKGLLDRLHADYIVEDDPLAQDTAFAAMTQGISFHDGIVVFEKRRKTRATHCTVGRRTIF
ncbi:class I SAM-dependent methyltransferase [Methylobacterium variabile]|jgi:cephalosporin hydroxylase|nr:class I SAM-dependent methyltransferase [Methylobacterium variabile]